MINSKAIRPIRKVLDKFDVNYRSILLRRAGHVCVVLDNGRKVFTGSTPSCHRWEKNLIGECRRQFRLGVSA